MGEPGTKELISLDELEAAGNLQTGRKHILSILVENKPGVLTRVAGLFARRAFNIDTLAVGPTDDPTISRITLTLDGAVHPIDQVTKQLHKLVNVLKIRDLEPEETLARELALFKLAVDGAAARRGACRSARSSAAVVDVSKRSLVVELTGTDEKIEAFEAHGAAVRADRDDAHGRDRDRPRAQRDLSAGGRPGRHVLHAHAAGGAPLARPGRARAARRTAGARPCGARASAGEALAAVTVAAPADVDPTALAVASRRRRRAVVQLRAARPRRCSRSPGSAACARSTAAGDDRFDAVAREWRQLAASAFADPPDGPRGAGLVAVGGFAFAPDGGACAAVGGLLAGVAARARGGDRAPRRGCAPHASRPLRRPTTTADGLLAAHRGAPRAAARRRAAAAAGSRSRPVATASSPRCRRSTTRARSRAPSSGSARVRWRRSCSRARCRCTRRATTTPARCSARCARRSRVLRLRGRPRRRDVPGRDARAARAPRGRARLDSSRSPARRAAARTPPSTTTSARRCCAATRTARSRRSSPGASRRRCARTRCG